MPDKASNIHPVYHQLLQRSDKEHLLHQNALCIWMTGLSGSGKSTIAKLIDIFRNPRFLTIFGELSQQETSTKDYLPFFEHHNLQST